MKHLKVYESFISESIWHDLFGKPTADRAAKDSLRSQGWSHIQRGAGKEYDPSVDPDKIFVVFNGQKFGEEDIEYAGIYDTGQIPRIENGKLIIANPQWRE